MFLQYLLTISANIDTAGRALSGWENPKRDVFSPRLVFLAALPEAQQKNIESFMDDLLCLHFNSRFDSTGDLRPLAKTAFASLLMYLPEIKSAAKDKFLFKQFAYWCQRHRLSVSQFEVSINSHQFFVNL
jgi:hypothetical protein